MEHHRAGLARLLPDNPRLVPAERGADLAERVASDWRPAGLSSRERAMVVYALKLNDVPAQMIEADVVALRDVGLDDAQILHLNLVVGYFAFANRLTLGLGVSLEPDEGTRGG